MIMVMLARITQAVVIVFLAKERNCKKLNDPLSTLVLPAHSK